MLVFESQTPQDLLKEIAEWLRMRALRANYVPAKTKKLRYCPKTALLTK